MSSSSHRRSRQVAGSFSSSALDLPGHTAARPSGTAGRGRDADPDHSAASSRRRSACPHPCHPGGGDQPETQHGTKARRATDRTKSTSDPVSAEGQDKPAPPASSARTALCRLPGFAPPRAPVHRAVQSRRREGRRQRVRHPAGGVPGTTLGTRTAGPARGRGRVLVAHAPHRLDRPAVLGAQLAAQPGDVDVDGAAVAHMSVAPDRRHQLVAGVHPVRVRHQVGQQLELEVREVEGTPSTAAVRRAASIRTGDGRRRRRAARASRDRGRAAPGPGARRQAGRLLVGGYEHQVADHRRPARQGRQRVLGGGQPGGARRQEVRDVDDLVTVDGAQPVAGGGGRGRGGTRGGGGGRRYGCSP